MNNQYTFRGVNSRPDTIEVASTQQLAVSRFISRAYGWMALGLALTALISYGLASSSELPLMLAQNRGLFLIAVLAELGLVMWLTAAFRKLSAGAATLGFVAYSCLNGVTLSIIFLAYSMAAISQVFVVTAGMFGGLALYGTVTRRDLTGVGSFVGMGLWGLILLGIVNVFMRSEALSMGLGLAGVIIFSGLTAYHAQAIRSMAVQSVRGGGSLEDRKGPVFGALLLYLNFINLFLSLLRLFGGRRN